MSYNQGRNNPFYGKHHSNRTKQALRTAHRKLIAPGTVFSRLTVLRCLGRDDGRNLIYAVRCVCGKRTTAPGWALRNGVRKSCGCFALECLRLPKLYRRGEEHPNFIHGKTHTPEYVSWAAMKTRVSNPRQAQWSDYGGRGIRICKGLSTFEGFFQILGLKPPKLTLDRADNDLHYSCGACAQCRRNDWKLNVRWAT